MAIAAVDQTPIHQQPHQTVSHYAELWGIDEDRLRRIFEAEPGVVRLESKGVGKRRYTILRIPDAVAERVHRRLSVG